ncbi:MAG: hypothetical protein WC700_02055 [Gemmatimonadaceae bacterium]|jgi:hypothetical protein
MELKYAHIADYAGDGANGKTIVVGIFDTINVGQAVPQIVTPPMCVAVVIEADVSEGSTHALKMQFVNEDGVPVVPQIEGTVAFFPGGPTRPMQAKLFLQFAPFPLPKTGDYSFDIFVDQRRIGTLPLYVVRVP